MNKETIHIENLSIGYPGKGDVKVVADGICAGINSGELTCLLGANGVGKECEPTPKAGSAGKKER